MTKVPHTNHQHNQALGYARNETTSMACAKK